MIKVLKRCWWQMIWKGQQELGCSGCLVYASEVIDKEYKKTCFGRGDGAIFNEVLKKESLH